jgi:hypothetical protein
MEQRNIHRDALHSPLFTYIIGFPNLHVCNLFACKVLESWCLMVEGIFMNILDQGFCTLVM